MSCLTNLNFKKIWRYSTVVFFGLTILSFFLSRCYRKAEIIKIDSSVFDYLYSEYTIEPREKVIDSLFKSLTYPSVQIELNDSKYRFVILQEEIEIKGRKREPIFFALKRISEISNWGGKMGIKGGINSLDKLLTWWKDEKPILLLGDPKTYFLWEASFVRFYKNIEQQINLGLNEDKKMEILAVLKAFKEGSRETIIRSPRSPEERIYLIKVSDFVYENLSKRIIEQISPGNYPLGVIDSEKNWGQYDIWLDVENIPVEIKEKMSFTVDDQVLKVATSSAKVASKWYGDYLGQIEIKEGNQGANIDFPEINLIENLELTEEKKGSGWACNEQQYSLGPFLANPLILYRVELDHRFETPVWMEFQSLVANSEEDSIKDSLLYSKYLPPAVGFSEKQSFTVKLNSDKKTSVLSKITFSLDHYLEEKEIENFKMTPVYWPSLRLVKVDQIENKNLFLDYKKMTNGDYRIRTNVVSLPAKKLLINSGGFGWRPILENEKDGNLEIYFAYWPRLIFSKLTAVSLLSFILFFFLNLLRGVDMAFFITKIKRKLTNSFLVKIIILFKFATKRYFFQLRYLVFILAISGIVSDIFFIRPIVNTITVFFFILWLSLLVTFNFSNRFCFSVALKFLFLGFIFAIFGEQIIANKLGIWAYLSLLGGVFQALTARLKKHDLFILFRIIAAYSTGLKDGVKRTLKDINEKNAYNLGRLSGTAIVTFSKKRKKKLMLEEKELLIILKKWGLKKKLELVFIFLILFFLGLLIKSFVREIVFYKDFFENEFWKQFWSRVGLYSVIFNSFLLAIFLIFKNKAKNKLALALFFFILAIFLNRSTFKFTRRNFESNPYILDVYPRAVSGYGEVKIKGRNFKDKPFIGKVLIDDREQRIKEWSDRLVIFEADPMLSSSGKLKITNSYDKGLLSTNLIEFICFEPGKGTPEEEELFWEELKRISKENDRKE